MASPVSARRNSSTTGPDKVSTGAGAPRETKATESEGSSGPPARRTYYDAATGPRVSLKSVLKAAAIASQLVGADAYRPMILGRDPRAFSVVRGGLMDALDVPVQSVNVVVGPSGYDFARNLVAEGPNGSVLVSSAAAMKQTSDRPELAISLAAMRVEFSRLGLPVTEVDFPVNWSDLASDSQLDLLVLAQPPLDKSKTRRQYPALGSETQNTKLWKAFGEPENVMRIAPAFVKATVAAAHVPNACYDLDMYLFVARNDKGMPVILIHSPCIAENAPPGTLGRAEFLERLGKLNGGDIAIVELSARDFQHRAANSINPQDGLIVFSEPVTTRLTKQLHALGMQTVSMSDFAEGREFGIHCASFELPESGRGSQWQSAPDPRYALNWESETPTGPRLHDEP